MRDVMVHLEFDETRFSPVSSEFAGLVENCLELAITDFAGIVPLCQSSFDEPMQRRGQFAEVVFDNRPMMQIRRASAIHSTPVNTAYDAPQIGFPKSGFEVTKSFAADSDPANFTIFSIFATGDGDDNKETNLADIAGLIIPGNYNVAVTPTNFGSAASDYDSNGETNLADLAQIAMHYQETYTGIEVMLGNTAALGGTDILRTLTFESGVKSSRTGAPFSTTDWAEVYRTWDDSITIDEMIAADTDEDGTVYISARVTDGTTQGTAFTGVPLTYETGPPVVTGITLDFPDSASYVQDPPGSGNYLVIITEKSVDAIESNNEPFAPESLGVLATLTIEGEVDPLQDNSLVVWNVVDGGGLGAVDNGLEKGMTTFIDRGRLTIQAQAVGNFGVTGEITFLLCSIDSIVLELQAGGTGPESVNSGDPVQLVATGTFDWDSVDNANEVDLDISGVCNWASLADAGNTGSFVINADTGVVNTTNTDSGDSTRITCEFPGTDDVTIFDNMKRASNFFEVIIN